MAIVKMKKFTLFAFEEKREALLKKLQQFGEVQFRDLQEELENEDMNFLKGAAVDKDILDIETEISKITFSLEFLRPYIKKIGGLKALKNGKKKVSFDELERLVKDINWIKIYEELKDKEERQNILNNEQTKLESEMETLIPWKNFDENLGVLKDFKIAQHFLGSMPIGLKEGFIEEFEREVDNSYVEIINEGRDEVYFLAVTLKDKADQTLEILKKYGFTKATINYNGNPNESIDKIKARILEIQKEREAITKELEQLDSYQNDLELVYEYYYNELIRARAGLSFLKSSKVVAIQGWVTENKSKELEDVTKNVTEGNYYIEIEDIKDGEYAPILLKNNGFVESFESIVGMYSLPNYGEIDPTPIMSVFYLVFFGMMLSDAGYGLIMVIATMITLKFFNIDDNLKKSVKLFFYLGISTLVWGAIYGSWFGDAPITILGMESIPKLIDPPTEIMKVMALSIILGGVHIFVGLGIKGYILIREKKYLDAIFDVGFWYVTLIGGILFGIGLIPIIAKWMLFGGLIALFVTQGRDADSIGGKIGGGLYGVYGITSYIGDFVSYSRLLALGLATGFISGAFNLMIGLVPSPIKYIVGPIIFVVGHLFNLGINALGAYVHANRLQYLEFFGKFYEGGGKPFEPFNAKSKYVEVIKQK